MKPTILRFPGCMLALFVLVVPALAGPPLICHRFEIGSANSLPWTGNSWNLSGNENYDTRNLVRDTLAILDANPAVLVRMETLRRATLYGKRDTQAAQELFTRLYARATGKQADALASFDAGYLAATYGQWLGRDEGQQDPATGIDGYALVKKALSLRGNDPEMEFAAALITLRGPEKNHLEHAQKAIAGGKTDPLLAQNLATHFLGEKQTVAEMLAKNIALGGTQK